MGGSFAVVKGVRPNAGAGIDGHAAVGAAGRGVWQTPCFCCIGIDIGGA